LRMLFYLKKGHNKTFKTYIKE
jgi:hypothetical protein